MDRPDHDSIQHDTLRVEPLMNELEERVRNELRERVLAHGGARDYQDPRVFAWVESVLRRGCDPSEHDSLLLPEMLGDDPEWRLETHVRFSSHRPVVGPFIIFVKKRLLLPLTRWLYEYTLDNFRRQRRLNETLISCVEQLAIENARLRRDLLLLRDKS